MLSPKKEVRAYFALTLYTLIIGLSFIFVKIALRSANTADVLAHRFTTAAGSMLLVYATGRVKFPKFSFKQILPLLGLSVSYPLLFFALHTEALKFTSVSEAGIVSAMVPVFTVIFAAIFLKEKSSFLQIISVLLSVAGIVYILFQSGLEISPDNLKGNVLILLSVLSIVSYYILGRKINKNYNSIDITFFMTITACVVFNGIALFNHAQSNTLELFFTPFQNADFLWAMIYLGVLSSFLTAFFSNYALAVIPAPQVAIFNNVSPLITILSGILLLGEQLQHFHIIGGLLVLLGVAGTLVFRKR